MAYYLQITDSVYTVTRNRKKVASIFQRNSDKKWVGKFGNDYVIAETPHKAFEEVVRALNRISICGVNNAEKAKAALEKRNEEIRKSNADFVNFVKGLRDIPGLENLPLPRTRTRRRKFLL